VSQKSNPERRRGQRFSVSFPIRVKWKDPSGTITEEGLTENVGPNGTLIYLPRNLPSVGAKVELTVTERPGDEVSVTAEVIRLERNHSHPQVALSLVDSIRLWRKKVWELAAETVAAEKPEPLDDW
jgi:hypothetical protein